MICICCLPECCFPCPCLSVASSSFFCIRLTYTLYFCTLLLYCLPCRVVSVLISFLKVLLRADLHLVERGVMDRLIFLLGVRNPVFFMGVVGLYLCVHVALNVWLWKSLMTPPYGFLMLSLDSRSIGCFMLWAASKKSSCSSLLLKLSYTFSFGGLLTIII